MRRALLIGLFWSGGAMAAESPRRRRQAPARRAPATASPASPSRPPPIDGPPPPSSRSGLEPAPVPSSNMLPPSADRQPRSSVDFGVPTPPEPIQGQSFGTKDSVTLQDRRANQGQGTRLPSPGATVRVPF